MVLDIYPSPKGQIPRKRVTPLTIFIEEVEAELNAKVNELTKSKQVKNYPDYSWLAASPKKDLSTQRLNPARIFVLEGLCSKVDITDVAPIIHYFRSCKPADEEESEEQTFARMVHSITSHVDNKERINIFQTRPSSALKRWKKLRNTARPFLSTKLSNRVSPSSILIVSSYSVELSDSSSIFTITS